MAQDRLVPGGRPPKHLLEPVKGADGIWRLDRVRHRAFNGEYTRSSGSGHTRKECLADWEANFDKNRRKGSVLGDLAVQEFATTDTMSSAFSEFMKRTEKRVVDGQITRQTYTIYRRHIYKSEGHRANPNTIRLEAEMGHLTIGEAGRPAYLARYLDAVAAIAPGVARQHHVVLSHTFDMLTLDGLFDVSPMAPVPKPAGSNANQRAMTPRERDQLYDQICGRIKRAGYFRVMYLTMLGTGIRPGEAFALWWEDLFDLDDPAVEKAVMRVGTTAVLSEAGTVRQNKRKHGTEGQYYYITLPRWLTAELREWKRQINPASPETPVFVSTMKKMVKAAAADANLNKATEGSELDWVTFGNFRDTVATHVAGKTGDAQCASAQLGHSQGATVARRHYIDRNGYIQAVVDNSEALESLRPTKVGAKLEYEPIPEERDAVAC